MSSCSLYLLTEQNNFPSSADLSDNTVRNIVQICALWQAYETELPQGNGKHIRNFQDPKLLTYGFCMRQVIAVGNYS